MDAAEGRGVTARRGLVAGLAALALLALLRGGCHPFPRRVSPGEAEALRELHVERGRQLLLAGDPGRALVHLGAAYRDADDDPGLRFLVARAAAPLAAAPRGAVGYQGGEGAPRRRQRRLAGDDCTPLSSADLSADRSRAVVAAPRCGAWITDPSGRLGHTALEGAPGDLVAVRFSPAGGLVAGLSATGRLRLWRAGTGELAWSAEPPPGRTRSAGDGAALAFSADGRRLVAVALGVARVWEPAEGTLLASFESGGATAVAFRPDGRRLVTAGARGALVWNAASGRPIVSLDLPREAVVHTLAYSPDGRSILAAGSPPEPRLFDGASGELTTLLPGHRGTVRSAAWSSGGGLLLTAGDDRWARLWDARRGWQLAAWPLPPSPVVHAGLGPRLERLATVHADGTLLLEPLPLDRAGPAEIDRLRSCFVPWRLASRRSRHLLPATPDPRACREIEPPEEPLHELASAPAPRPAAEPPASRLRRVPAPTAAEPAISLRLRGADLVETVRSFARMLDRGLLISPGVHGRVDADLTGVSPYRAFEELLRLHHLAAETSGPLLLIVPEDGPELPPPEAVFHPGPPVGWPGEPIGMSLRDADLAETLHSFSLLSGTDLIVDPDVSGPVSAELSGVPWDRVLVALLRLHDLRLEAYGHRWRIRNRERAP
jgi:hypothetical protein